MDTKIKLLLLSLFTAFNLFGQSPLSLAVRYNISSATGGDPYTIVGVVSDDLSRFTGSDVAIGDSLYVIDGSDLYVLKITAINSVVGPTVNLTADDPSNAGISLPTGQSAIVRPTPNYKLPIYISGLRDDLRSMMMNRQAKIIDQITGGGSSSITDFTSAGENVPPSAAASSNGGETWRNMTTGELWGSNGTNWYPYTRGPKECQDTVLVSAITVQSGGSVTTGSPLIRNSSGVWEHMYNHPSGLNLVPDGVVTDIVTGGKAIIQYCGVRKGSGATPNTSYYVNQSISTGFTTTKPTTNIRPLGKVASNGDFLINAGLLFSRDNSQALPANQVGFGNSTGTAITSDANLKYLSDTLLINQGQLKVKNTGNNAKILIDSRRPLTWPGSQTGVDAIIMQFTPPVDRNVTKRDTSPNFYLWQEYSKYHQFQTGDHVFGMGMNLGPGNQKITPNFPAIGFSIENWYQPLLGDTTGLSEFNFTWLPKLGGLKRIFSFAGNNTTGTVNALFVTDALTTQNAATGKTVFQNTGNQFEFLGSDATGSNARPFIYMTDQRNILKRSIFVADTATLSLSARKYLQLGLIDTAGWIELNNRINNTRFQFGATNTDTRTFFNTSSAASGNYYAGGSILLGGYCSLSKIAAGGYGAVGSNYYLANGNGPGSGLCRASSDVANGIEFLNNTWVFWNAPSGAVNSTITRTVRATISAVGWLAVEKSTVPSYAIDAGNSTDAIRVPNGTTAQAPSPSLGIIRLNTTTSQFTGVRSGITPENFLMSSGSVATLMREESFTATAAQTAFTIAYSAPAVSGTSVPIRVYRNGVRLFYVASGPTITQFTYSGTTVTTAANTVGDIITIEYLN